MDFEGNMGNIVNGDDIETPHNCSKTTTFLLLVSKD
jgi:hypothetical protein